MFQRFVTVSLALTLVACAGDDDNPTGDTGMTATTPDPTTPDPTTPEDPFVFADDAPDAYTRVDRMGMPAINTAVISSKDAYNAADPTDDVAGMFVKEIIANVDGLHVALDDDLMGLKLTPCATADCVGQAAPLVVPDTLKIDTQGAAGFPNGRTFADPVMDVTLAVVLLDLTTHPVDLFATLPLNPPANDLAFGGQFPYLASPSLGCLEVPCLSAASCFFGSAPAANLTAPLTSD